MDFEWLFSVLTKEPFNISPSEFKKLSLREIELILAKPEDLPTETPLAVPKTDKERFFDWGFYNAIPPHQVERLWQAKQTQPNRQR